MKIYVTFGQIHTHSVNGKTFDKDCVAEIEAPTYSEARDRAFALFDGDFCFTYPEDKFDKEKMKVYFSRGIIKVD